MVETVLRNTVTVKELVDVVNRRNRFSKADPKVREGWNDILADILIDTGNYKGFKLLSKNEVPPGHLPGVSIDGTGDDTRRFWNI